MKSIKYFIAIIMLSVCFLPQSVRAQSGMRFGEFARKLDPYFDKAFITDVKQQLPQGSEYKIWGWDVGDFSGDGYFDVAFAVKLKSERKRKVQVFMFADIEGYLVKVGEFPYQYFEIPLEIGVVIKDNTCMVTKKNKKFDWLIRGYTFDNGSLLLMDEFHTSRVDQYTYETYKNYKSLKNSEKFLKTRSGKQEFATDYMSIPSYPRGKKIYKGYASKAFTDNIDYVHRGAYHWKGEDDASFTVSSAYDKNNLYFTVKIKDDKLVKKQCDTCEADFVQVWFELLDSERKPFKFYNKTKRTIEVNNSSDSGIYCFNVYPGDFLNKKSHVKISSTDELDNFQTNASKNIRSIAALEKGGYILKFKIPFSVLGFQTAPVKEGEFSTIGCTFIVHDIDNEFRPEEKTEIATSSFSSLNPSSYGCLTLVPQDSWYGSANNIFEDDILRFLSEYGF